MNTQQASIRMLLQQNQSGMGYDAIARATGVTRDKVPALIAALITAGDVAPFEVRGEKMFRACGKHGARQDALEPDAKPAASPATSDRSAKRLHEHLFKTLEQLEAGTIDHVQAKARAAVADQIIKLANVQLLYAQLKQQKQLEDFGDMPLIGKSEA